MRLEGKVAIVTGSASGMGEAEAKIFAREGAKVIVADVDVERGQKVESEIAESGGEAIFSVLDVTKESDWERVVSKAIARYGKVDILVNNAGISGTHNPDQMSVEGWDAFMEVNAKGVFLGMKYVIPEMQKVSGASIVNISSISGIVGQELIHMGYNASKGAVRIATKAAAVQYAKDGIRVNSVHPGVMPPMRSSSSVTDPGMRKAMTEKVPMGRIGSVDEVAHAVLFMASDDASYLTGAELVVDGGYTAI